jgi:hypothetical protein
MTGSGKTYSMSELSGSIFADLYRGIDERKARDPSLVVSVKCSYAELYNEVLKDLLSGPTSATGSRQLAIRETSLGGVKGLYVKGLTEHNCNSLEVSVRCSTISPWSRLETCLHDGVVLLTLCMYAYLYLCSLHLRHIPYRGAAFFPQACTRTTYL